ncbi:FAD:protein FMN transferase, partial [Nevskia soli]|uniref:FAD:protein FMN transferase n=1 Tax=Nevskia soli TaxID=418856 RepID=UPI0004A6E183
MEVFSYRFKAMGGPCEVRLHADDRAQADRHAAVAKAEILRLEQRYSRYREDSFTTLVNRSAGDARGIEADAESAALLDYAQTAWEQSGGLFDITSGVLRRVWDFKARRVPAQAEIDGILPLIGWQRVRWERPRLVLPLAGMELDFGGYVKEYAADRAAQACRDAGARHGFVELAGDIALIGAHPDGAPWQIGVRHPRAPEQALATIPLAAGAIASSGDYERYFEVDGLRYSHLLNPKTGWPVRGLSAVSVVAPQCLIAGTASTIAMLKGAEAGPRWLGELGLRHLCVAADGVLAGTVEHRTVPAHGPLTRT